jgi:hypothetical protein
MQSKYAAGLLGLILIGFAPAFANEATTADYKQLDMIAAAQKKLGSEGRKPRCAGAQQDEDEIVVCGRDHGERWRVPPTSETEPDSPQALRNGALHPPDFAPKYPGPVVARGCLPGSCPKEFYIIDLATIPVAPEGSDADRVGKGELSDR